MSRWSAIAGVGFALMVGCVTDEEPALDDDGEYDQGCYDACIAKGAEVAECEAACTKPQGDKPEGDKPEGSVKPEVDGGDPGDGGGEGVVEGLDPEVEKPCIQCWYDEAESGGTCEDEAKACEASLACTQLQWCPTLCGKPECFDECNAVIPSGVEALTALARCAVCDDGPCADECEDSLMRRYCD